MSDGNYGIGWKSFVRRLQDASCDAVFLVYRYLGARTGLGRYYYKRKLIRRYNIFIFKDVSIGSGLKLPHPTGIVIGKGAVIGNNVTIYQQVTIGGTNIGDTKAGRIAHIGDGCVLFAGARILGGVELSENTQVGANAVLLRDTEAGSIYAGVPAKRIR